MSLTRRLAAILFADIEGYTAIMHRDEILAEAIAEKFHKHLLEQVALHNGRVQKWNGDGAFCSFDSAVEAVEASIAVQKAMREEPVVPLRIGIHTGDVVLKEDELYGDVVNIASRIESFAQAGGVFISAKIYDEIRNQKDIKAVSLGMYHLKNVIDPMQIFAISSEGLVVPARKKMLGKGYRIKSIKLPLLLSIALVLIALVTFAYLAYNKQSDAAPKSIAVLPFVDLSATKDQEYFGDGLSEELLNRLSKIKGLKVIARMSSFSFRGANESIQSIGEKLGVTHILQGSVRKSENKIRITAQLTMVKDGTQIWSETYDRVPDDIFKIQDDISLAVVNKLKATLAKPDELSGTETNPQAYNLVLKADYFAAKGTSDNLVKSRMLYEEALSLDSTDARIWASLSHIYLRLADDEYEKEPGINKARQFAEKAIALNPDITNGYVARGRLKQTYDWDWKGADADYEKAFSINPDDANVIHRKASLKRTLGDFAAAIELYKYAVELDPVNTRLRNSFGVTLMNANQLQEAKQQFKKTLELRPEFETSRSLLSGIYLLEGKVDSSRIQWEQEPEIEWRLATQALYYQAVGPKAVSDSLLTELISKYAEVCSFQIAENYSWRNNADQAFYWLDQAYLNHDAGLAEIIGNPFLKNIESDPRYAVFLKKMGLPINK